MASARAAAVLGRGYGRPGAGPVGRRPAGEHRRRGGSDRRTLAEGRGPLAKKEGATGKSGRESNVTERIIIFPS